MTRPQIKSALKTLTAALKVFGPRGTRWIKNDWCMNFKTGESSGGDRKSIQRLAKKGNCRFCLDGVLEYVVTDNRQYGNAVYALETFGSHSSRQGLIGFNDAKTTTFADIRTELKGVITELKGLL